MPLFKETTINFMGPRRIAVSISVIAIVLSIFGLVTRGLELGLDFTGGVTIEVQYDDAADLEGIRSLLEGEGYSGAVVQNLGAANEVRLSLPPVEAVDNEVEAAQQMSDLADEVVTLLQTADQSIELRRADFVGPQLGDELVEKGGQAMLWVLVLVFLYIVLRFRWKFAAGAISALVHDVIITFGFFAWTGLEFNQSVLAAVLAVIGYSLNDTIVVYDRIRENFRLMRRGTAEAIINTSINQTLSRTIITGATTLLVLFALYLLGGETVAGFSVALIVGIIVGTYSSIYVASAAALFLEVSPADLIPPKREAVDDMP